MTSNGTPGVWLAGLLALAVASPVAEARGREAVRSEAGWHTDYAAARELARRSGKPLFVVFR